MGHRWGRPSFLGWLARTPELLAPLEGRRGVVLAEQTVPPRIEGVDFVVTRAFLS